jgi:hypothetical protein
MVNWYFESCTRMQCWLWNLLLKVCWHTKWIEDITRRHEDTTFIFELWKQYFTNERSEWVKYCLLHEKIKVISSSHRVMFCLLYSPKQKIVNFHAQKQIGKSHVNISLCVSLCLYISLCVFQYLTLYYTGCIKKR